MGKAQLRYRDARQGALLHESQQAIDLQRKKQNHCDFFNKINDLA